MTDTVDPTPTAPQALEASAEVPEKKTLEAIEVSLKKKAGGSMLKQDNLPLRAKGAHLLGLVATSVIAVFVTTVLADGSSVVNLKSIDKLPRLTDKKWIPYGLDYRADELLGPSYGVGLHHDSSGRSWDNTGAEYDLQTYIDELGVLQVIAAVPSVIAKDDLKHPVQFLQCRSLRAAGQSAMVLGFIACVAAVVMIVFHGAALVGLLGGMMRAKLAKVFNVLIWLTLTAGFLIVIGLALGVMETTWVCNNEFIPSIKLAEHFDFNYGLAFGYTGYVASLLTLCVMMVFTSTTDGDRKSQAEAAPPNLKMDLIKVLAGVTVGLLVNMTVSLAVAGSKGAFDDSSPDMSVNFCEHQKPYSAGPGDKYFKNVDCMKMGMIQVLEQAGANITKGFVGGMETHTWRKPITEDYDETDLCPVNVHWHLGAEHLSVGQFDEYGTGPADEVACKDPNDPSCHTDDEKYTRRRHMEDRLEAMRHGRSLAAKDEVRLGFRCHHYDKEKEMYTKKYQWKHCTNMEVGETYEVHWPHSAAGACGTKWQYQTPFYDGVFCKDGIINILTPLNTYKKIGVQGQVFTIVNPENENDYYYPDLFKGMMTGTHWGEEFGMDMAKYTGSTTGTSRDNGAVDAYGVGGCSRYAPITWQVDRTCHKISAKSFDDMCAAMKANHANGGDNMEGDLHPHGARKVVWKNLTANNQWDQ